VVYIPSSGTSGSFGTPQTVATGTLPIHPALAMDSAGVTHLTWANNTAAVDCGSGCSPTSPNASILYAQRSTGGTWSSPETVATGANSNIYLDQSPNIITNSNNVPYVVYIDGANDHMHIVHRTGANTWVDDSPAAASYGGFVHDPTIYSQGTDIYAIPGHSGNSPINTFNINYGFQYELGGAGGSWSPFQFLDNTSNDGSASVRWDPARENDNRVIDTIYFNEDAPTTMYYMAIQPRTAGADTTPPTATIGSKPASLTNSTSASFSFTGTDNVTPANQLTFQCALDGAAFAACTSPQAYSGLTAGSHTFQVKSTDQAGNVSTVASYTWNIDTSAPTAPTNLTATAASSSQINLSWTAATDNTAVTNYQITRNGAVIATVGNVTSYNNNSGLSANTLYTYSVLAIDGAGNQGPASNQASATTQASADTTPPTASITSQPANPTNATTASFSFTGTDNVTPANQLTFQCSLDSAAFAACTSPQAYSGLAAGSHNFRVESIDQAGNVSTPASYTWTIDTTAPTVSMTAPANNATVSGTSVTVSATASDNAAVVGVQFKLDGANLSAEDTSSPYSITWNSTTATNGMHTLTAVARDAAGNTTTATSITVTVNNTSSGQFLVGDQTVEATSDSNSGGTAEAFRITATNTGTLNSLVAYVGSATTSSSVLVGLYASNGTHPGALLTSGTITNPTKNAWNTVTVSPVSVTAGTNYWIAILAPNGGGTVGFRDKAGGGASETDSVLNLLTLPANWTTGSTFTDGPLSAYGQN
jgi:hypothetical protein